MNTKIISQRALDIIEQYRNFRIGNAICSIPYYNNKSTGLKGAVRAEVGKGHPKDIYEEIKTLSIIQKLDLNSFTSENLKTFLVENNIGVDCSAFAYYILNEESLSRSKGTLDKHIQFVTIKNIFRKIRAKMVPEMNIDVLTFADNANSSPVSILKAEVGDIITLTKGAEGGERNHIMVIHQIEYQNSIPITLHYSHSVAWPTDGEYGHGIHQGKIDIIAPEKGLLDQRWIELEKTGNENYTFSRAIKSTTELRRLNIFLN